MKIEFEIDTDTVAKFYDTVANATNIDNDELRAIRDNIDCALHDYANCDIAIRAIDIVLRAYRAIDELRYVDENDVNVVDRDFIHECERFASDVIENAFVFDDA